MHFHSYTKTAFTTRGDVSHRSLDLLCQILPLQVPPDPRDAPLAHQPELCEITTHPSKVLHHIVRLYPQDQASSTVQDIDTFACASDDEPISGHFQTIRYPLLRIVERTLVDQRRSGLGIQNVILVDRVCGSLVPSRAVDVGISRGNHTVDGCGIADVDGFAIGRDGDAVGLAECVVYDPDLAGRRTETVALSAELRGSVCQGVEPRVVCTESLLAFLIEARWEEKKRRQYRGR